MVASIDGKPHLQEYLANAVDPDVRIVHREQCAISEKAMKEIIRQPFSLPNELPARWIILQDTDAYRVYLVGHHIVVDGQSMTIISKEFLELLDNPDKALRLGLGVCKLCEEMQMVTVVIIERLTRGRRFPNL